MAANVKLVYSFGDSKTEGRSDMKDLLGGKGAALAGMCRSGAPVPPGFTITTDACRSYYFSSDAALFKAVPRLRPQFDQALKALEDASGRRLGDPKSPLLVSVRSGAKFSMPGMMDTILNLGLNDECVEGLAALTGDRRFALDSYRRFIQMFSDVVKGTGKERFEEILEAEVHRVSVHSDRELNEESLERVVERYKDAYRVMVKDEFPQDPRGQLIAAVEAVFRSWKNPRAFAYRKANNISDKLGTACNVQKMVFGNMGEESGTGVGFTRDPGTGEKIFYGEYLPNAQGEDVVAGEIAETAEFFSFGTNDLTQMLFGFSRDDYGKFIDAYLEKEILPRDPFQTLDREGVGRMVRFSVDAARKKDPKFKLGVCGEHGGDPDSIEFFHEVGLDYVSCSTYRVPAARLAAAQAAVKEKLARKMKKI